MHTDESRNPSRRDFLASGLAAAGVLALGGRPALAAHEDGFGPFKVGLQSYSLREFMFEDALARTKDLGVHYWESYSKHTPIDPGQAGKLKELAAASGVKVVGFGVSPFTKDHDKNRKIFEFGKAMGVDYLSADPMPDAFDSLDKLVEEFGIAIGIHNHGPEDRRWSKIDTIAAAIKDHHKLIGACVDAGHYLRSNEDPVRAVEVFGKRTFGVHLKDVKGSRTFTILGEGDLRVAALLQALAKIDYQYCVALEYEENPKEPIADIRKCLDAVRMAVKSLKTA